MSEYPLSELAGELTYLNPPGSVSFTFPRDESVTVGRPLFLNLNISPDQIVDDIHFIVHPVINTAGKFTDGRCIEDWSFNGTYVNGMRIVRGVRITIESGDIISLGGPDTSSSLGFQLRLYPQHSIFRKFNFGSQLGQGASGAVYIAYSRTTGRRFAIKRTSHASDVNTEKLGPDSIALREIGIMKQLRHAHIIRFIGAFIEEEATYAIVELAVHGTLWDLIDSSGGLDEPSTKTVGEQMCMALEYLHIVKGIVHRDIKPENILISSISPLVIKLSDFGLAKAMDVRDVNSTICGTSYYTAPEIVIDGCSNSGARYDEKVDSWSLGVTLFESFAAVPPFNEDEYYLNWSSSYHYDNRVIHWRHLPRSVSREARNLVAKLLLKDPGQRLTIPDAMKHQWFRK